MKKLSDKVIVATGIEMAAENLFAKNDDDTLTLWIRHNWNVSSKTETFAPVTEIFSDKESSTHKVKTEEMYFVLPVNKDGVFMLEAFINRFIDIERL